MILLAASVALAAVVGGPQAPLPDSGVVEEIDVRRVPWPVLVELQPGAEDARCRALTAADVVVEEQGVPARVVAVDQGSVPTLYTVVVDTSGSMSDFLPAIGEGLASFVSALGARERVMIASLDDDFVLLAPPTADRDLLLAAASRLRYGTDTLIRESIHDLLLFLESRPGRKVLFIVTDGGDSQVVRQLPWARVVDAAAAIPDLTVFVVGVASSRAWQYTLGLREIAVESGGLFHEVPGGGDVGEALLHLRRRVRREATIVYEPPAEAMEGASRRRRVRVRPADGVPCRLISYRATRIAHTAGARALARRAIRWDLGDAAPPACAAGLPGGRWLGFSAVENLVDPGPLYDRARWRGERHLSARMRMSPESGARALGLWLMSADELRATPRTAAEVAWQIVTSGGGIDCLVDSEGGPGPLLAHGRTYLEARPELARRVAEVDPAWDRFAWSTVPQAASLEDARTEALAAWHGDLPAREFLDALQALGAGEILRAGSAAPRAAALGAAWPRLVDAFAAAHSAGVLALLVPVLDPEREAVGYWRIALQRPQYVGPVAEPPSHEPLLLATARWLAAADAVAAALPAGWPIEQASQAASLGQAVLRFAAPDGGALLLTARFPNGPRLEPRCVAVSADPPMAARAADAARGLADALAGANRLCPPD